MQNMFNRLPTKLLEHQKLSILFKNIQPYYQQAICREKFESVAALTAVLRVLEHTKINCENFREPAANSHSLEPDLAFTGDKRETVNAINNVGRLQINASTTASKCRGTGDFFRDCRMPKQRLFCYKCRQFGVTTNSCQCNSESSGNERAEATTANRLPP